MITSQQFRQQNKILQSFAILPDRRMAWKGASGKTAQTYDVIDLNRNGRADFKQYEVHGVADKLSQLLGGGAHSLEVRCTEPALQKSLQWLREEGRKLDTEVLTADDFKRMQPPDSFFDRGMGIVDSFGMTVMFPNKNPHQIPHEEKWGRPAKYLVNQIEQKESSNLPAIDLKTGEFLIYQGPITH